MGDSYNSEQIIAELQKEVEAMINDPSKQADKINENLAKAAAGDKEAQAVIDQTLKQVEEHDKKEANEAEVDAIVDQIVKLDKPTKK